MSASRLGELMLADGPAPDQDVVINEDRALVHARCDD